MMSECGGGGGGTGRHHKLNSPTVPMWLREREREKHSHHHGASRVGSVSRPSQTRPDQITVSDEQKYTVREGERRWLPDFVIKYLLLTYKLEHNWWLDDDDDVLEDRQLCVGLQVSHNHQVLPASPTHIVTAQHKPGAVMALPREMEIKR